MIRMAQAQSSGLRYLWLLAVLIGVLRLGFVLTHEPLAGFANQFDMLRVSGCLGLTPDTDDKVNAATPMAPIERYRVGGAIDESCLYGTEVALAGLALVLDRTADAAGLSDPATMPLRLLAWVKALLLLISLAWMDWRLRAQPSARVAHAWIAALVLVDPFNTLYLAGFYTEFAALLSAYLALLLPLVWLLARAAPGRLELLLWGLALAALALSRFQHAAIPFVLLIWFLALALRKPWSLPRLLAWPLLVLLPALTLQLSLQQQYQTIADANRWNSFFGAALPAAEDPVDFVTAVGLPAACAELLHSTWYLQRGRDARVQCPQAFQLSRVRWTLQLLAEPAAMARMVGRGVSLSGQWRPSYLGELAGGRWQRMPGALGLGASIADAVARLPFLALLAFWSWPLLAVLGLGLAAARSKARLPVLAAERESARIATLWLLPMLAMIAVLGWASSLIGDGYSELARHLHLAANASLVAILLTIGAVLARFVQPQRSLPMRARWGLAAILMFVLATGAWINQQSLAFGVLELPADERRSASLALSGWALDPRGIAAIDAVSADGVRHVLQLSARPALQGIFGSGVGAFAVGFSGSMPLSAATPMPIAIEVTPRHGAATVIDRRWIRD